MAEKKLLPIQYQRQFADSIDPDYRFADAAARTAYLSSPRCYPGQPVYDIAEGKAYLVNPNKSGFDPYSEAIEPVKSKAGTVIAFGESAVYNGGAPVTGNITFDFTGAKLGTPLLIVCDQNTVFPVTVKMEGELLTGTNYVYLHYISNSIQLGKVHGSLGSVVSDSTAPAFSSVSINPIYESRATFNVQINEAGTIYWAVYPTADVAHSKADILAGTGALDFGSIATGGDIMETAAIEGLASSTAYKVHFYSEDDEATPNETAVILTDEFITALAGFGEEAVINQLQEATASGNDVTSNPTQSTTWAGRANMTKKVAANTKGSVLAISTHADRPVGIALHNSLSFPAAIGDYDLVWVAASNFRYYCKTTGSNLFDTGVAAQGGDVLKAERLGGDIVYSYMRTGGNSWIELGRKTATSIDLFPHVVIYSVNTTIQDIMLSNVVAI